MASAARSSEPQEPTTASPDQTGLDPVERQLKRYGLPFTRENYLRLAYLNPHQELGAEEEANLPEWAQKAAS